MSKNKEEDEVSNSLNVLAQNLTMQGMFGSNQLSQTDTMQYNNRWYLLSNNRQLLSQMYAEHGIVQTLVDVPVDDAFRHGVDIASGQLDANDIEKLKNHCEKTGLFAAVTQALKWTRLFGGGGVLLITPQSPDTPLDVKKFKPDTPVEYQDVDMWELYEDAINIPGTLHPLDNTDKYYHYYAKRVHKSRVYRMDGKKPPSFIRPRLRGWGMSELERLVRSINSYLKNQDVVFELLDEAKIDIYRIEGFNTALANLNGTANISKRIQFANMLKNYNNALTMDIKDEYQQKQINFSGLDDILAQIRIGVAADLRMPVTKLFGISAAGFSSGEDDIENYNSMVESEIRGKVKFQLIELLAIPCYQLFGFVPDDLKVSFPPLRIMSAEQEEKVKDAKFGRVIKGYQSGLVDPKSAKMAINKDALLPVELEETDEIHDNMMVQDTEGADAPDAE